MTGIKWEYLRENKPLEWRPRAMEMEKIKKKLLELTLGSHWWCLERKF